MYPNDKIRPIIKKTIDLYKTEASLGKQQIGIDAEKAFHCIKCFVCMDSQQVWDHRKDFFSRTFASDNYDILKCNVCGDGSFIRTTNQKLGFKKNQERTGDDLQGQIEYLADIYNNKIKPEEEKKKEELLIKQHQEFEENPGCVWGKGYHQELDVEMKHKSFDVNIGDMVDKVIKLIRAYGGDFIAVANLVKNLTLEIKHSVKNTSETKESFSVTDPDRFGNSKYIIIKIKKVEKEVTKKMYFNYKQKDGAYKFEYLILSPKNKKAREECRKLINSNVDNIIDKTRQFVL